MWLYTNKWQDFAPLCPILPPCWPMCMSPCRASAAGPNRGGGGCGGPTSRALLLRAPTNLLFHSQTLFSGALRISQERQDWHNKVTLLVGMTNPPAAPNLSHTTHHLPPTQPNKPSHTTVCHPPLYWFLIVLCFQYLGHPIGLWGLMLKTYIDISCMHPSPYISSQLTPRLLVSQTAPAPQHRGWALTNPPLHNVCTRLGKILSVRAIIMSICQGKIVLYYIFPMLRQFYQHAC